jgi:hypothetical protein
MEFVNGNCVHAVTVSMLENELAFSAISVIPAVTFFAYLRPYLWIMVIGKH